MSVDRAELRREIRKEIKDMRHLLSPAEGEHGYSHYNRYVRNLGRQVAGVLDKMLEYISVDDGERRTN